MSNCKIENSNSLKILFILFILVNLTTSLLTKKLDNYLDRSSENGKKLLEINQPFYTDSFPIKLENCNHTDYFKNVPINPKSIGNKDHNFESIESTFTNRQSSVLLLNQIKKNDTIKQHKRAINNKDKVEQDNLSKVFNQTNKTNQTMTTNLDVNSFETTALNLPINDTFNETHLMMSVSSKSPFLSSSLTNDTDGPDLIYIEILKNTRFWVQRVGKFI